MSTKTIGIALVVVGVLMIVVALLATTLGLSHSAGFGTSKIALSAVGLIVGIVGGYLVSRKKAA
jgi:uncharacterized protein YneF (UPF0154 family)